MMTKSIVFATLAVLSSTAVLAVHPKDEAVDFKRRADAAFAAHREEKDPARRLVLLTESAEYLEKIVLMEGCADEALLVEATDRASERFRNLGDSDRALKIITRTLSVRSDLSPDSRLRLLMSRAALEEAKGYSKLAEKTYAEALKLDTRDMMQVARVRNRIATILTDVKGQHAAALAALDYRVEDPLTQQRLTPKMMGERAYIAGCALRGLKRFPEAKSCFEESVRLFEKGRMAARGELALARVCLEMKDRPSALSALDRAVALEPGARSQADHLRQGIEASK